MLTVDEIAKELGISPRQVYHLAATNRIPHYRVGSLLRFKLDEVLEAFRGGKVEA